MLRMTTEFRDGETVVRESMAERVVGMVSHGGKLWLTDQRLIFKSRAIFDPYELSFPLSEIASVETGGQVGVSVMVVTLRDGQQEKFHVFERRSWMAAIDGVPGGAAGATRLSVPTEVPAPPSPGPAAARKGRAGWLPLAVIALFVGYVALAACVFIVLATF